MCLLMAVCKVTVVTASPPCFAYNLYGGGEYGLPQKYAGGIGSIGDLCSRSAHGRCSGSYVPLQASCEPDSLSRRLAGGLGCRCCDLCGWLLLGILQSVRRVSLTSRRTSKECS